METKAKWVNESKEYTTTVPLCPAPLERELEKKIKETAIAAYQLMGCRGYTRVDF